MADNFSTAKMELAIHAHTETMRAGAVRGVTALVEHILGEAIKIVPIEEGTLQASGATEVQIDGDHIHGAVGFGAGSAAAYAVPQHEHTEWQHDQGREDHYLLKPFLKAQGQAGGIIAGQMS